MCASLMDFTHPPMSLLESKFNKDIITTEGNEVKFNGLTFKPDLSKTLLLLPAHSSFTKPKIKKTWETGVVYKSVQLGKPVCKIKGSSISMLTFIYRVAETLENARKRQQASEFRHDAMGAEDNNEVFDIASRYVRVEWKEM